MGLLSWIIVGLLAGWLAEKITGRDQGLITNLVVGIIGAMVGGFLFHAILGMHYTRGINLGSIFVATIGAIVFLWLLDWLRGKPRLTR